MLVKHILGAKGREIIAIAVDASLADAASLLARRRIGAVIVRDGQGGLSGILSERDVVRAVAEHGVGALAQQVSAYMTREVATCGETDSIDALMEMMTTGRLLWMTLAWTSRIHSRPRGDQLQSTRWSAISKFSTSRLLR